MNPDLSNLVRKQVFKNRKIWKKETNELHLAFISPDSVWVTLKMSTYFGNLWKFSDLFQNRRNFGCFSGSIW